MDYTGTNTGAKPSMGERIKEAIPGTEEYRATHGVTGAHANVQGMKSHIPGTEEHRMREAGVVGGGDTTTMMGTGGGHHTGTHMGGAAQPTMGERVMQSIPGTNQHEATHGMTGAHRAVEQGKSYIPGTEEHHLRTGMEPGGHHHAGMGTMGTTAGVTDTGMMGTHGTHGLHHDTPGVGGGVGGVGGVGGPLAGAGMMSSSHDTTTGMGHTAGGTGYTDEGKETVGHKIKKMIPGTREHEEKKVMEEGRI